ncbi:hypothetical protein NQ314_012837, partial [Rhamnusium bicolor]
AGKKRKPLSQLSVEEDGSTSRKKSRATEDVTNNCQRRAGVLNYMILKNFMCHSLLEVKFTNNINIVIGKNGSGKSAILTALIVGLGGKASLTNRGSSVKGFVKAGKPSGSIEIDLYNEGPMAYRPSVYGNRITIVRNLSANGGGSYRIRSENAREVQNITTSLNIQVDNPICILNQDTSRNFLSSNDPKNKFTLFMRATKLETLEYEYKKIQSNKRESVKIMEEKEDNFRKLQDEIKRLKRKIDGHKTILNLKDKKSYLQRELVWAKVQDAEEELEQEKSKVNTLEKRWNECKANSEKRVERINTLKENIKALEHQIVELKDQINVQNIPQLDIRRQLEGLSRKYANENGNLRAIRRESGNDMLLYGRNMPRIKQMIEQYKHKFEHEPRGPLGSYIKLKDKKWAVAVEGYLGAGTLQAFAVDNNKDNQLLREIFNKVCGGDRQPQIISSKFVYKKHDVKKNLVNAPEDCVSLYDAIEIEDPIVSNCIVDSSSPENILLIPNDRRAQELLSDQKFVPRNCSQGVTIKGDKYYPDPNYRSYGSHYHRAQYLQVDTKEYMQQLEQNIESLTKKKQIVNNQLNAFTRDMRTQTSKKNELEEKIRRVNQARLQIRRQLEDLQSAAEPEVQNVQYLEQELEEVKKSVNEKTATLGKVTEELKEIKLKIVEKEQEITQLKNSTKGLEHRAESLQLEIREYQTKQKEISTSDEFEKRQIQEFERRLNVARSEMVLKQTSLKKYETEASSVGERLPDLRRVPDISNEILEIKHRIARIETDTEDVADVMDRFRELSEKFSNSADIMKSLQSNIQELSMAMDKRKRHYKLTESYFITYIKHSFKKILEYRQFKDKLNRTKVIDILLHHANSKPLLQFVFLTPQDVSFINKDVSILRLQDPERFNV